MDQYNMKIVEHRQLTPNIFLIELNFAEDKANHHKKEEILPGQFFYIRVSDSLEPLLRRPISVYDYDDKNDRLKMIYRVEGEGTRRISKKKIGESLDVFGPLGNGYPIEQLDKKGKYVLLGGGIGIPPLYYLARKLKENQIDASILLGYHSAIDSFLVEEFSKLGDIRIASIDGTLGVKGTVLDLISEEEKWDTFFSCGPIQMLRAIQDKWKASSLNGYISLEERMGCGIGACYGCIVKVDKAYDEKGYKKVCSDGPVFPFREVIL